MYEVLHEVWCELVDVTKAGDSPEPETLRKLNEVLYSLHEELD